MDDLFWSPPNRYPEYILTGQQSVQLSTHFHLVPMLRTHKDRLHHTGNLLYVTRLGFITIRSILISNWKTNTQTQILSNFEPKHNTARWFQSFQSHRKFRFQVHVLVFFYWNFSNSREALISFVGYGCLSFHLKQFSTQWTDCPDIKCWGVC